MKHLNVSRYELYEQYEKNQLNPLSKEQFELYERRKTKVNIDYDVQFECNYYSIPCHYVHKNVEIRITTNTIEIYLSNKMIAVHKRLFLVENIQHTKSTSLSSIRNMLSGLQKEC